MSSEEQRIREFAYQIWQSEGCPEGQEERHWTMARKLAEAEHGAAAEKPAASRPRKAASKPTDATSTAKTKAKDATAAKPRATRAVPKADTEAKAGTPEVMKKTRTPRAKKES